MLPGNISSLGQLAPLFPFAWTLAWLMFLGGAPSRTTRWVLFGYFFPATALIAYVSLNNKSLLIVWPGCLWSRAGTRIASSPGWRAARCCWCSSS